MPAFEAGVRSGDIILAVDGEDLKRGDEEKPADYSSRVTSKLRGEAGTSFKLTVKRPGVEEPLTLSLTRRVIERSNVLYSGMLDQEVGIIVVTSFMENTARDVRRAFVALKQ
jgi:carboxyl-terminal processing protease